MDPVASAVFETDQPLFGSGSVFYDCLRYYNGCVVCANFWYKRNSLSYSETLRAALRHVYDEHKADCPNFTKPKVGNGVYQGPFAFTLTKSPKDPQSIGDMLAAVKKIMRQGTKPVVKYAWYYEDKGVDEMGSPLHPHIHGMYETVDGGMIPTRQWQRAWPLWDPKTPMGAGFKGGYHRPVRSDEGYSNYIKKDGRMNETFGFQETD